MRLAGLVLVGQNGARLAAAAFPALALQPNSATAANSVSLLAIAGAANAILLFAIVLTVSGVPRGPRVGFSTLYQVLKPAAFLSLSTAIGSATTYIDKVAVASVLGVVAVATYANGAIESPMAPIVTGALTMAALPRIRAAFAINDRDAAANEIRRIALRSAAVLFPVGAVSFLLAPELVTVLYSDRYIASYPVLRLFLLLVPLRCLAFGPLAVALDRPRLVVHAALILMTSSCAMLLVLPRFFGIEGAAMAVVLAQYATGAYYIRTLSRNLLGSYRAWIPTMDLAGIALRSAIAAAPCFLIPGDLSPFVRLVIGGGVTGALSMLLLKRTVISPR
jgi:O-antigen/teichoic acid export membrane protein